MSTQHPSQQLADEYAAGFRALADLFQANPALAEHARYAQFDKIMVSANSEEQPAAVLAEFVRAAKARGFKIAKDGSDKWFHVGLTSGRVGLDVFAAREEVCERVVTGTETVTKTVKDPAILATVPDVEVTEEVEIVKWECKPLLAAEQVNA